MPTLFSTLPGAPKRVRRKCPSPRFTTREEAVAANKPGRFGIDRPYAEGVGAPHAYGYVFRDAVDELIPQRRLLLSGFRGTLYYSKRRFFNRNVQNAHLKELGIKVDREGVITSLEVERAAMLYPGVAHLVTEQGDLRAPGRVEVVLTAAVGAGNLSIRRGCFGVPFWKAMKQNCRGLCTLNAECDAIVDYRLTFGGREAYDRSYSPHWAGTVKMRIQRLFDSNALMNNNQHFQRMRFDPDIQRLLSVYTGLWYLSDLTARNRVRDAKWDDHAPFREESVRLAAEVAAEDAAAVAAHLAEFRERAEAMIRSSLGAGDLAVIDINLRKFFDGNKERKWRKPAKMIPALSAVELARVCVRKVVSAAPTFMPRANKKAIAELANLVCELGMTGDAVSGPTTKVAALSYNAVDRRLATLNEIRGTGVTLLPKSVAAKVGPEPELP